MGKVLGNSQLVSYCGLYCGACKSYLKNKCPGCRTNGRWKKCKMRPCCIEKTYQSCANCVEFNNVNDCSKFSNIMWRALEFIFRVDRKASIDILKKTSFEDFANLMAEKKSAVIKRRFSKEPPFMQ